MLIEFMDVISVDKKPFAENLRLNVQPKTKQLRLKVTYINDDVKTPVDIVVFKWVPNIEKLSFGITIDGKELTTETSFVIRLSFDAFKRQLKITGNVSGRDINMTVSNMKNVLEIPKAILPCFPNSKKVESK